MRDVHLRKENGGVARGNRLIGLAENFQVDRPERHLGEDSREDRGNPEKDVEKTGDDAGERAGGNRAEDGQPRALPGKHHHRTDGGTGTDRTVHRQVGDVQNLVGNVYADGHNAPNQTLGDRTGQSAEQIHHDLLTP